MLKWLRQLGRRRPRSIVRRVVRARYDAAQTTDENRRHWTHADGLSADAAASPAVRRILRNRARYEIANNAYAKGMALTLANDVVGTGPRLQLLTEWPAVNQFIEREFAAWARVIGLAQKLHTLRMARTGDGEGFGLLVNNPNLPRWLIGADGTQPFVELDLRLVEADQVTTPGFFLGEQNATDGIVFDAYGNPVVYHVLRHHPGDARAATGTLEYDAVPTAQVIHYFRAERPGQTRGIPEITPAIPLFAQLRRYTQAVLAAAETAADQALAIYTDTPPDTSDPESSPAPQPMDTIELEPRMATVLPDGWKLGQVKAEQPATTYGEFKDQILNEIARCLNMPFNIAAGNSAKYNYASGRLDHQTYFKAIRIDRDELERDVLDRLFAAWFAEAVLFEGYLPELVRRRNVRLPHAWFWDGFEHVDPVKEANAQAIRLANHATTLADECARGGNDWETQLRQRAREYALMHELGLPIPVAATQSEETEDVEQESKE